MIVRHGPSDGGPRARPRRQGRARERRRPRHHGRVARAATSSRSIRAAFRSAPSRPSASRTSTCTSSIQVAPLVDFDSLDEVIVLVANPDRGTKTSGDRRRRQGGGPPSVRRARPGFDRLDCRGGRGSPEPRARSRRRARSSSRADLRCVAGFWAGLVLDDASLGTLGAPSLLLTLAGHFAGRFGEATTRSSRASTARRRRRLRPSAVGSAGGCCISCSGDAVGARTSSSACCFRRSRSTCCSRYPIYALARRIFPVTPRASEGR